MNEYAKRLTEALKRAGISQAELARRTGIKQQSINYLCNLEGKQMGSKFTPLFAEALEVNAKWLSDGLGEMEKPESQTSKMAVYEPASIYNTGYVKPPIEQDDSVVKIPFLHEVELSMGNGRVIYHEEPEKFLTFNSSWLTQNDVDPKFAVVVKCSGDSMVDRIHDGDVALIKTDIESIESEKYYAINYDGEAKLKILLKRADGSIVIHSKNQNGMYPDEIVRPDNAEQLSIIGRAVWFAGTL
ncbi:MAG: helix-turn-helix domain-containing protein [Pseudomonadales bacterium]|nr:helix-turn-helix domain-containing protein [Pseudomonadales bacterium]